MRAVEEFEGEAIWDRDGHESRRATVYKVPMIPRGLVASVQASEGSPLASPEILLASARASLAHGVTCLRLEGVESIRVIKGATDCVTMGLIKRSYPGSEVYISATKREVMELIEAGCEIVALDGTSRPRPNGETLSDLITLIHEHGRLAMADCDTFENGFRAQVCGADIVSTTLAGYTNQSPARPGPDLEVVRQLAQTLKVPVFAEGRFTEPWQVTAALRAGAHGVVIGGAINDPVKQTKLFGAAVPSDESVTVFDIGGTWLRCAVFQDGALSHQERHELPADPMDREQVIRQYAVRMNNKRVGISTGGTIDPRAATVIEAKPIIPDYVGTDFHAMLPEFQVTALNDGLATAWGHACHPKWAGKRVLTLALGTGVGCGLVDQGRIFMGPQGEYPRLNDVSVGAQTFEDLLGGAALSPTPSPSQMSDAQKAADAAMDLVRGLYHPDVVVVCGGVGLSSWLSIDAEPSPYGADAGLIGAGHLVSSPGALRS